MANEIYHERLHCLEEEIIHLSRDLDRRSYEFDRHRMCDYRGYAMQEYSTATCTWRNCPDPREYDRFLVDQVRGYERLQRLWREYYDIARRGIRDLERRAISAEMENTKLANKLKTAVIFTDSPISSPSPIMGCNDPCTAVACLQAPQQNCVQKIVKAYKTVGLKKDEKTLRKGGLKDENGKWTQLAYQLMMDKFMSDNEKELVAMAEAAIAELKDSNSSK